MNKLLQTLTLGFQKFIVLFFIILEFSSVNAQVSTKYTFSSTGGTSVANLSGGIALNGAKDAINTNVPIGFTFVFNSTSYSTCGVSNNGFLWFGSAVAAGNDYSPISSGAAYEGVISAFGDNLSGGGLTYLTQGTAPNRTFTVQWLNYKENGDGTSRMDLLIVLHETTNVIHLKYRANEYGWSGSVTAFGQVGLRGLSNGDFFNRSINCSGSDWNSSNPGGTNSSTCRMGGCWPGCALGSCYNNDYIFTPNNNPPPATITTSAIAGSPFCNSTSNSVSIPYTISGTFNAGNTFTAQLSDASGNFGSPTTLGTLVSTAAGTISGTIPAGLAGGAGYKIRVVSSNPVVTTDPGVTITITAALPVSVSITASANPICSGQSVSFTATPVNGGVPTYQWKVGVNNAGTGVSIFTTSALLNSDIVTVIMTSSLACKTGSPATSPGITMTVNSSVAASISISSDKTTICSGATVNFTATPSNGIPSPTYQWKIGSNDAGTNSSTFSPNNLNPGDIVSCILSSSSTCVTGTPKTSNTIPITVNPSVAASIVISADKTTICSGATVNFTATPGNGIASPSYQWKIGSNDAGANSPTFSPSNLNPGDIVSCILSSGDVCVTGVPKTSNTIPITVNQSVAASITISSDKTSICAGTIVNFTATPGNGIPTPSYEWKIGGNGTGNITPFFSTNSLNPGDVVSCVLNSGSVCVTGTPKVSNTLSISVNPIVSASVSITPVSLSICSGQQVTFSALTSGEGNSPSYQWKVNGIDQATTKNFATSLLNDNDSVICVMTSSEVCATGSPATSNTVKVKSGTGANSGHVNTLGSNNSICLGASIFLLVNGNSDTVRWQSSFINGNFTDIPNSKKDTFLVKPNQTTYYRATTGSGSCVAVSDTFELIVKPVPTSSFDFTPDGSIKRKYFFNSDASTGALIYEWDFDDGGATSDEPNPTYTFTNDAIYHVCLKVTNGLSCTHKICEDIDISLGINNILADGIWKIYPVPFHDYLVISSQESKNRLESIEIYDLLGRLVFDKSFEKMTADPLQIDLSILSEGMYYLKIIAADANYFQSVIKQ